MLNLTKFRHQFGQKAQLRGDLAKNGKFDNTVPKAEICANDLTLCRQWVRFERMSSREGYQRSGEWNEFDNISLRGKIRVNELNRRKQVANLTILRQRRRFRVNELKRRVAVDKIHKNTE